MGGHPEISSPEENFRARLRSSNFGGQARPSIPIKLILLNWFIIIEIGRVTVFQSIFPRRIFWRTTAPAP